MRDKLKAWNADFTAWRRDIHAHPELAFEETRTSDIVAAKLESFGLSVHRGLGKTGVVGTLKSGRGNRAIGLRADMDALPLQELGQVPHKSVHDGKMHACGHDGHTTMLLAAARYLAETKSFDGTVHFIFQPAEENEGGGQAMVRDGLFEKFPVEGVYGMHNLPGIPVGDFAMRVGPIMAASDRFDAVIHGKGAHAAFPHTGIDPILVASHVITAWQSLVSRYTDPLQSSVLSVTSIHAGDTYNVIPDSVSLRGTVRSFDAKVQDRMEAQLMSVGQQVCAAFGASLELEYRRGYPATVNTDAETQHAIRAATALVGKEHVNTNVAPLMGSEDFAFMLQARPGCYIFIGNGAGDGAGSCMIHNPHYDFNDSIIPLGASYWVQLVEDLLPQRAAAE
jgi:amidohydrolase